MRKNFGKKGKESGKGVRKNGILTGKEEWVKA